MCQQGLLMFIRCAFFEGRVLPGQDDAFRSFVRDRLVPLWTRFPGADEVRVLYQRDADTAEPHYAMVLAIRYPSLEAIDAAMQSPERASSRALTQELITLFDGRIFHTVFDAAEYPMV
jgi:antibiotic biosynthesis monooxygenase (ABM) superfamily enzyme